MIRRNILKSFVALILLASISSAQFTPPGGTPPGGFTAAPFNKAAFDQSLAAALGPNVMGYQYAMVKNGTLVTDGAGGKAANAADGDRDMTPYTPAPMGSLSKFLSGTAMLHFMEKDYPGSRDIGDSLQAKLNRNFTTIVPAYWTNGMTPGIENITIRQLLQHRSGFDDQKGGNRTVLGYMRDADGFVPAQYNVREYSNINFVLNGYLIPLWANSALKTQYDFSASAQALFGADESEIDQMIRDNAGATMHTLMKNRIWNNMTPKIYPNCDAANTLENSAAYFYQSKNDNTTGGISSAIDSQGHCGGAGYYYLSSRAIANYMAHFSATNLIVENEARDLMFNDAMNPNDRLVWGSSSTNNWIANTYGMPNIVWSNGKGDNSEGGYRAVIIRLPLKHYLVIMTNSPELSTGALFNAGVAAFQAGMQ
jgi:hypothetical protein